ncbi:MAG: hypothetical protein QXP27_03225 [Candidatus Methanomethyliaceae archaeon]
MTSMVRPEIMKSTFLQSKEATKMSTRTIRISAETHEKLAKLAQERGMPMARVLAEMVEWQRRYEVLEASNRGYAALRQDPAGWAAEQAERELWEATVGDGEEQR